MLKEYQKMIHTERNMAKHTAKKNYAGNYTYRGWELDKTQATFGPPVWRVVAPNGKCGDWMDTLRDAKARVDTYLAEIEAGDINLAVNCGVA